MSDNAIDEIDKDTLVSLLKEKGKEIKTLENKNKKLEERYVKIFRENKNLKQDKETLEKLLQTIFDRDQDKFTSIESGTYDLYLLTNLWAQREDEKIRLFNETLESHKNEKVETEKKVSLLEEQLAKVKSEVNPEIEKMFDSYKARSSEMENANKKLNQEIKELNDIIEGKQQEIEKLKNAEYEVDSLKAELLMKELQIKNINEDLNIKSKMQENERKNEVLRLRHDLESAQEKIRVFEAEKQDIRLAKASNLKHQSVQTESTQESHNLESNGAHDSPPSAHNLRKPSFTRSDSDKSFPGQMGENGQMNQEYLKNVVVKLFCYLEGNNMKEAKILMNAIMIILKFTPEDRMKIEDAKKGTSFLSSTVHFIKDTFTSKGEVNYYTSSDQR